MIRTPDPIADAEVELRDVVRATAHTYEADVVSALEEQHGRA